MSYLQWVSSLSDEYIVQWANKGLLRRGYKQLEKEDLSKWIVGDEGVLTNIDDHEQRLSGIGFDNLTCSCSAQEACFHLTCMLLGLLQLSDTPSENKEEAQAETSVYGTSQSELPVPWLLNERGKCNSALGKAFVDRALRWINQGVETDIEINDKQLIAQVHEKDSFKVIIPRIGGIENSLCSCKKDRCAHRAITVVKLSIDAGANLGAVDSQALDDWQKEIILKLKDWMRQVALSGMSGISRLTVDQGKALATELQQADLPNVARVQNLACSVLSQELNRQLISSPNRLRKVLAELSAYVSALSITPMPQALITLAGEHRRNYRIQKNLNLTGICSERWETLSGYLGHTSYFYCEKKNQYYTYSEARRKSMAEDWSLNRAYRNTAFGAYKITELIRSDFTVGIGWCSEDGRISGREGTVVTEVNHISDSRKLNFITNISSIAIGFVRQLKSQAYGNKFEHYHLVGIEYISDPVFNPYLQVWSSEATDNFGNRFNVVLTAISSNRLAVTSFRKNHQHAHAIFGAWYIENGNLTVRPICLYCQEELESLNSLD